MTIEAVLDAVVSLVRQADPAAVVGVPDAASAGLCVWPWRVVQAPASAGSLPRPGQPRAVTSDLQLLVLPRSASSTIDLAALDRTLALITALPVLRTTTGTVQLTIGSGLAHADLAALFTAAGIPMTLAVEVVARSSST